MSISMKAGGCLKVLLVVMIPALCQAQYFGQNKAQYKRMDFTVLQTPHFSIYNYLEDDSVKTRVGRLSELWCAQHQSLLKDTFRERNPLIIYNNHEEFQQTSVIPGLIGTGTGGVTEAMRNRMVLPFHESNAQTSHILGHEMAHAFQYHLIKTSDSASLASLENLPLWLVEGMAEYMSTGRLSPLTAMWMRDAVLHKDVPTLQKMTMRFEYFPYRFGEAFWAYVAGIWGDTIIRPLFDKSALYGYSSGVEKVLGVTEKELSAQWEKALHEAYVPYLKDTIAPVGIRMFHKGNTGEYNISPALSPDGKYLAFFSEKSAISIDLYLADAAAGKIIRKLSRAARKSHIDDIGFLESAGAWSPDSRYFAYPVSVKGRNKLAVVRASDGKLEREVEFRGVTAFSNPAWSPGGNAIVVTGMNEGYSDLYMLDLRDYTVLQLTNDYYSDLMPQWSPDGKTIVFASDRGPETDFSKPVYSHYRLCLYDMESNHVTVLNVLPDGDNLNPYFSSDGSKLYFLTDADGFRNLYEYDIAAGQLYQLTRYFTGISGITFFAPAISVAGKNDKIVYSLFDNRSYSIYLASLSDFPRFPADPLMSDKSVSILPPAVYVKPEMNVASDTVKTSSFRSKPYQPMFGLSAVGSVYGGVGVSSVGPAFIGGATLLFSDMLNRHYLFTALQAQGDYLDIGGAVAYLNQKHRFNFGVAFSHTPYKAGALLYELDTLEEDGQTVILENFATLVERVFEDQVTWFSQYPFSQKTRLEAGVSLAHYAFRREKFNNYFSDGYWVYGGKEKLPAPESYWQAQAYLAYVFDNATWGMTSPLGGQRLRLEVQRSFIKYNVWGTLADYRKYFFAKPVGFAFRGIYYARYGSDAASLFPLFVGNDYFVRGYNPFSFRRFPCRDCVDLNAMVGSSIAVANAEARLPFTGPERLALIRSRFFYTDLVGFFDCGLAWDNGSTVRFTWNAREGTHTPVFSTGVSLRINFFGVLVMEPYYAFPFQRNLGKGVPGFLITAGGW
ncbi:MAG TPA: hypothetical protein VNJ07_10625 [Chitinophagales bacterium]|nr:hypothetical protein [Chitinophagales bacterium]